ncbi:MAG TPA: anthranilate phosphoribosyltransferase [Acidimicrobiales bacterium]|jgi:anthranilate phosphoribosyltransferase|nr:anthranilate phosphoribosyltransferase [Acidimicrobiales bacterium]
MPDVTLAELGGWPFVLGRLMRGEDLTSTQAAAALGEILDGNATDAQIAAFAVGLRIKGESVEEIAALVRTMVAYAEPVNAGDVVDTCGTGGDRSHSINVSTLAAFAVAGAGAKVCKHGNRAASSAAGSADVLEALGVTIDLDARGVERCIAEAGMGFCFAPKFHPASRHAVPARRELGVPTVFNFLGPLANPGRPRRQLVGVSDPAMAEKVLGVLEANDVEHAMVVYGHDGLDELTTTTTSTVLELLNGEVRTFVVDPATLGLRTVDGEALRGGDPATNAEIARRVLSGEAGPHRDVVVLNAAAGMVVAGLAAGLEEGVARAQASIDEGKAAGVLDRLVAVSGAHRTSAER